jgi:hypothetical protein
MQYILNITDGSYFKCKGGKDEYIKKLNKLFTLDYFGTSRWIRNDKIIFVPIHLHDYVDRVYDNVLI